MQELFLRRRPGAKLIAEPNESSQAAARSAGTVRPNAFWPCLAANSGHCIRAFVGPRSSPMSTMLAAF